MIKKPITTYVEEEIDIQFPIYRKTIDWEEPSESVKYHKIDYFPSSVDSLIIYCVQIFNRSRSDSKEYTIQIYSEPVSTILDFDNESISKEEFLEAMSGAIAYLQSM